jgi:hypothetical protein
MLHLCARISGITVIVRKENEQPRMSGHANAAFISKWSINAAQKIFESAMYVGNTKIIRCRNLQSKLSALKSKSYHAICFVVIAIDKYCVIN